MKNKRDLNKDYILDIAEEIFAEKGFKECTLADIAKKAKISKGTLYYYYSAKKDIISDVADRHLGIISESIKRFTVSLRKNNFKHVLKKLLNRILNGDEFTSIHLSLLNEASTDVILSEKIKHKYNEWFNKLEMALQGTYSDGNKKCSGVAALILSLISSATPLIKIDVEDIASIIQIKE
jgi:AcrR family transcriptional regulator